MANPNLSLDASPLELEDLDSLRLWLGNENVYKNLYQLFHPMSIWDLEKWYEGKKNTNAHMFKFINKEKIMGIGMVHHIHEKNRCGELSVIIDPAHIGRGIGKNILLWIIRYAFMVLNLHKIFFHTADFNMRILSMVEELQFTPEGKFRKELFAQGQYHDIHRYGMLAEEYFKSSE